MRGVCIPVFTETAVFCQNNSLEVVPNLYECLFSVKCKKKYILKNVGNQTVAGSH